MADQRKRNNSFKAFFKTFLENTTLVGPVYHGGKWDGRRPISTTGRGALGTGAYFTPIREVAENYAKESGGVVVEAFLDIVNPLVIHWNRQDRTHPCVEALVSLGMERQKAQVLVERVEEQKGYLGKEISSRAIPQGYDALYQYIDGTFREIVIWDSRKVQTK